MTGPQPPYGESGGQWPAGGGWQNPSDQTQYGGPPQQGFDQPQSYEQPGYQQYPPPQSYDQYGQQGYPDQYSAPPAGYQEPYSGPPAYHDPNQMPPGPPPVPQPQRNNLPLILGGAAVVLVLVLLFGVVGWLVLDTDTGGTGGGPGGNPTSTEEGGGKTYAADNVNNACDLIDVKVLGKWAESADGEPDHNENRYSKAASFSCFATYKTEGETTASATLSMSAQVGDYADDSYKSSEEVAKGSTGSGKENGNVPGVGDKAYFASEVEHSEYFSSVSYQMGVLHDNLTFNVRIWVFSEKKIELSDVEAVCKEQANNIMKGMKA